MFLAPARDLQIYEMAEIKDGVLETKARRKPSPRQGEPKGPASNGLANHGRMGMPNRGFGTACHEDTEVPGGRGLNSVELFTGAGGLALGIEAAGFHHDTVVERNKYCCYTIRQNQARGFKPLEGWHLFSGDVRAFDYSEITTAVDLLAGGPPCQPFSIGGKHKGPLDSRDMFPEGV